jgi:hypothetical protein
MCTAAWTWTETLGCARLQAGTGRVQQLRRSSTARAVTFRGFLSDAAKGACRYWRVLAGEFAGKS